MLPFQSDSSQINQRRFQVLSKRQCWSRRSYQERLQLHRLKSASWKPNKQASPSHQEITNEQN